MLAWRAVALATSLIVAVSQPLLAEVRLPEYPFVLGTVDHLDDRGFMHLRDISARSPDFPERETYVIEQFDLKISPAAMALMVEGRRVDCSLEEALPDRIVGRCSLQMLDVATSQLWPIYLPDLAERFRLTE